MMLRVAENTKCPISFSIAQDDKAPQRWRQTLDDINDAAARGLTSRLRSRHGRLACCSASNCRATRSRPIRATRRSPFAAGRAVKRLQQPEVRAAILGESASATDDPLFFRPNYDKMYLLGDPPDYEQPAENALGPQARKRGRQPEELAYDAMLRTTAAACSMCRSSIMSTAISTRRARC